MKFQFDSLHEFIQMAGHGPYVWSCYLITIAFLVFLIVNPVFKHRKFLQVQNRQQRLHAHQQREQFSQNGK